MAATRSLSSREAPTLLRWLLLPLLLAAALYGMRLADGGALLPAGSELAALLRRLAASVAWLVATVLGIRLLGALLWDGLVPRYTALRIPRVLRQLLAVVLFVLGAAAMLNQVWGVALAAVLATTGVLGIVFGLALRNILADFFSGIALNLEQPFRLDDFVVMRMRGQREPIAGVVREINWRSTRVLTPEDNLISVPNSVVAAATLENLSFPSPVSELELEIVLDWAVDPVVIETVLAAAMVETWAIGATCGDQPPKCRICRLDGSGVAYKIIYLMDPRRKAKGPARHALLGCVHKHLRHAGLRPVQETPVPGGVPPQQPVDHGAVADRTALLQRLPLLAVLTAAERETLAAALQVLPLATGAQVVRQGDAGGTMYVVAAGVLEVRVSGKVSGTGAPERVATLGPGDVFGEMSLLTGAPRSASVAALCPVVLYEVTHTALAGLLQQRPVLADALSQVVSGYQQRDADRAALHEPDGAAPRRRAGLAERIRAFFGA